MTIDHPELADTITSYNILSNLCMSCSSQNIFMRMSFPFFFLSR